MKLMDSLLKIGFSVVISEPSVFLEFFVLFFWGGVAKSRAYCFCFQTSPSTTITVRRRCLTSGSEEMTGFISSPRYMCQCVRNNPGWNLKSVGCYLVSCRKPLRYAPIKIKYEATKIYLKCPKQCLRCKTTTSTKITFGKKNMQLN